MRKTFLTTASIFILLHCLSQNVGIGTTAPTARLHVADSSVVFTGPTFFSTTPGNTPVSGGGKRLMWYADKAAFRVGLVESRNWNKDSIGFYSFASGYDTKAKGTSSVAMGEYTTANGSNSVSLGSHTSANYATSTAMGASSVANAYGSTSMGHYTTANGFASTSMGSNTTANGSASTVIGIFNSPLVYPQTSSPDPATPLFIIGNGDNDNARTNAMAVFKNGNVGIGSNAPAARLHVADSSVVFTGSNSLSTTPGNPPVSGAGVRLMWYPDKAAFRVGAVVDKSWDKDSIGSYSFASGNNTKAKGEGSVAMGINTTAKGYGSVAMGENTTAKGTLSISLGNKTSANASVSTALGFNSVANGNISIATGDFTTANGYASTAMGNTTTANGNSSTSMGYVTNANGYASTSMGYLTTANGYASTVIGLYNLPLVSSEENPFPATPLFIVGNGDNDNARTNAMAVFKSGNVGIGNNAPTEKLVVNGNIQVQNNKGIIRSNDGTQQKKVTKDVLVNVTLAAGATTSINFSFPESFSAAPDTYVGNVLSGSGGWAEVVMTVFGVSTTGGVLYIYNPRSSSANPNFTVRIVAIGAQ